MFNISCKLSLQETICIKYQSLFSGKNKKNIFSLLSAGLAKRELKANNRVREYIMVLCNTNDSGISEILLPRSEKWPRKSGYFLSVNIN